MLRQRKDQDQGKIIKLTSLPECVFKRKGNYGSDARGIAQDSGGSVSPGLWTFITPPGHGGSAVVLFSARRDSRMAYPSAARRSSVVERWV